MRKIKEITKNRIVPFIKQVDTGQARANVKSKDLTPFVFPINITFLIFVLIIFTPYICFADSEKVNANKIDKKSEIVWLEFKLPPNYNVERQAIKEADTLKIQEDYKKYLAYRVKYEGKYREAYNKRNDSNPEFLKKNPYKYPEFETTEIDYNAPLALIDVNDDGYIDNAFSVLIIKEGNFAGQAKIVHYKKDVNGNWKAISTIKTFNDIGLNKVSGAVVTSGCQKSGMFISPYGNGEVINLTKEAKQKKAENKKIRSIIQKELNSRIQEEKANYKDRTKTDYSEELRINGTFLDVNNDGVPDIIAMMNNPEYMYEYPDGQRMSSGSRFQLFCLGEKGCEYYLLLGKGHNNWEKIQLGYAQCIAMSDPQDKGIRELYTDQIKTIWNGSTYKVVTNKQNWLVGQ